jgi:hypothetical protein
MKKILSATLIAGLFSGAAFAQTTVSSANIVGYVTSDRPAGFRIQGTSWKSETLQNFFGLNYKASKIPTLAQRIHTYTPGAGYQSYFCWADSIAALNGGTEWRLMSAPNDSLADVLLENATAVFMQTPANGIGQTLISGEVNLELSVTNSVVPGYQLLAYPFSADVKISELNLLQVGTPASVFGGGSVVIPTTADVLYLYVAEVGYVGYFVYKDPATQNRSWRLFTSPTSELAEENIPVLSQGEGFFYLSRGSENKTWVEARPYTVQ